MKLKCSATLLASGLSLSLLGSAQAAPTASVSSASVTPNPLCRDGQPAASATVGATFDTDTSSTSYSSFTASSGTFNGMPYTRTRTKTLTSFAYTDKQVTATADGTGSQTLTGDVLPCQYSASVSPSSGDGIKSSVVAAIATEVQTATPTTCTEYWTGSGQGTGGQSTLVGTSTETAGTPVTTTLTSATASATASYVVDLTAPVAALWPDNNGQNPERSIRQSQAVHPHVRITGGSAGQPYTLTAVATAPDGTTSYTSTQTGTFGSSKDGIANPENKVWALQIPCDAPLGQYTLKVSVDSSDLCGTAWPEATLGGDDTSTFTVTSGLDLSAQTFVVAQLADGSYGDLTTFTDTYNKKTLANNTTPGSFHATTTVTTAGPCVGQGSFTPTKAAIILDPNFAFADTGSSPTVHVFIGDTQGGGFDLNSGKPLTEVTLPYTVGTDLVTGGATVVVDLSSLGTIPSTTTIYARAHCRFNPAGKPSASTTYTFGSGATSSDLGEDSSSTANLTVSTVTQTGGGK